MKHIKTIYLGCDSHELATSSAHVIRFCHSTIYAHATIMDLLGSAMWEAHYQADFNRNPKKFCVMIPKLESNKPSKPENKSTGLDTITWFIENLHPPKGGAIFSLYEYEEKNYEVTGKWSAQVIWPLNKNRQWVGGGDYITLHDIEPAVTNDKKGKHYSTHPTRQVIEEIDSICPYKVRRINYIMDEEEIFEILKYSKFHISYHGGTMFTAGMINIPTICYGWPTRKVNTHWHIDGKWHKEQINQTSWNDGTCNPVGRVHQYDWDKDRVIQKPQSYLINVSNPIELKSYIMDMKEHCVC